MGNDHQALIAGAADASQRPSWCGACTGILKPARIDEVLEVTTRAKESTLPPWSRPARQPRGVELFTAEVMVVLISASGKPMRLSTALREALQPKPA
jgi:acyl-CoA thioesterase FadM